MSEPPQSQTVLRKNNIKKIKKRQGEQKTKKGLLVAFPLTAMIEPSLSQTVKRKIIFKKNLKKAGRAKRKLKKAFK
jgi:hypothetical protein